MLKVATVFSGIGAIEQALKRLNINHELIFACDNGYNDIIITPELENNIKNKSNKEMKLIIDTLIPNNNVKKSFMANYSIKEENYYQDVRYINGNEFTNNIDLFVGGSPCQSFSIIGERGGFEDTRGTLFYEFARLIKEIKPKIFIYENVKGVLNHNNGITWNVMKNTFDELNYKISYKLLNSKDYGVPQSRPRIFVVGIKKEYNNILFQWPSKIKMNNFNNYLDTIIDQKYYINPINEIRLYKRLKKNFTKIYEIEKHIDYCGICQMTDQQQNLNGNLIRDNVGLRYMTPNECLKLMGFENFNIVVNDREIYKQCGNSIVVDVLMKIMTSIYDTNIFNNIINDGLFTYD